MSSAESIKKPALTTDHLVFADPSGHHPVLAIALTESILRTLLPLSESILVQVVRARSGCRPQARTQER